MTVTSSLIAWKKRARLGEPESAEPMAFRQAKRTDSLATEATEATEATQRKPLLFYSVFLSGLCG